uniref:Glycosyltransferase n=1 Tax=Rhodiola rosea TaxID=203015 RepID=A0A2I6B3R3_RHORB|nr:uridine 5'-diphospho-glucosyltransferase 20 [Rhodiola rosea]
MGSLDVVASSPHAVLFPFMSKGHTIPLLHLARLLLHRKLSVTIITTPLNLPFISTSLSDTAASFVTIPFPTHIDDTILVPFANATKRMKPDFDRVLSEFDRVDFLVSDGFLSWTYESAASLNIKHIVTYGMCAYACSIHRDNFHLLMLDKRLDSVDELFESPSFPWIKLCSDELGDPWNRPDPTGPLLDFITEVIHSANKSFGIIFNSVYELERPFVDYWAKSCNSKPFCLGPLCLSEPKAQFEKRKWIEWLDLNGPEAGPVLYAAFGTQAALSETQLQELAKGLESSGVRFLWVVKSGDLRKIETWDVGFLKRVKERGMVVSDWVNQREILSHEAVKGFLSHCGWNSVTESLCAGVPILAWPMMAEQHLNARMVVEELKVGVRAETCDGTVRGFVKAEGVERSVKRLFGDDEVRRRVAEVKEMAAAAVAEGGSSWRALTELIDEAIMK